MGFQMHGARAQGKGRCSRAWHLEQGLWVWGSRVTVTESVRALGLHNLGGEGAAGLQFTSSCATPPTKIRCLHTWLVCIGDDTPDGCRRQACEGTQVAVMGITRTLRLRFFEHGCIKLKDTVGYRTLCCRPVHKRLWIQD